MCLEQTTLQRPGCLFRMPPSNPLGVASLGWVPWPSILFHITGNRTIIDEFYSDSLTDEPLALMAKSILSQRKCLLGLAVLKEIKIKYPVFLRPAQYGIFCLRRLAKPQHNRSPILFGRSNAVFENHIGFCLLLKACLFGLLPHSLV